MWEFNELYVQNAYNTAWHIVNATEVLSINILACGGSSKEVEFEMKLKVVG